MVGLFLIVFSVQNAEPRTQKAKSATEIQNV